MSKASSSKHLKTEKYQNQAKLPIGRFTNSKQEIQIFLSIIRNKGPGGVTGEVALMNQPQIC